ncbi:MAG: hypothetical protein VXX85_07805 [Candidatus Margulisiibacteriota bacterium]|nr:hypothetical protein [Candidatus Margulisiibacteriota bacterium]
MINQIKVGTAFLAMASVTRSNPICQNVTNILNNNAYNSGTVSLSNLIDGFGTVHLSQLNTTSELTIDDCTAGFFDTIYDCSNRLDLNKNAIKKSGVCENTQNNITDNDMRSAVQQLCTEPSSRRLRATENYSDLEFLEAISNQTKTPLQQYVTQKVFKCEELTDEEADTPTKTLSSNGLSVSEIIGISASLICIPILVFAALKCRKNITFTDSDQAEKITTNEMELPVSTSTVTKSVTQYV